MQRASSLVLGVVAGLLGGAAAAGAACADGDADDFRQNCATCHTIGGGRLVGPDLKDVAKRQERAWLVGFVVDPAKVLASGDTYAAKILAESRNVPMPPIAGMNARRAGQLLDLIEAESALPKSKFASLSGSTRAFTAADVERGRRLYLGLERLSSGGPACIACHQAGDAAPLGGGRLGPDLTDAFTRLGPRAALQQWMNNPPTATMKPLFRQGGPQALDDEQDVIPLLAFLERAAQAPPPADRTAQRLIFVLLGVAGAAVALVLMDFAWRRRFRGVRASLVKGRA
jgi:cytochrome c2